MKRFRAWLAEGWPVFPLVVLFGLAAADNLDAAAFQVLLPNIRDDFGLGTVGAVMLVIVPVPLVLLLAVPVGFAGDRRSRVRFAVGGQLMRGISTVLTALSAGVPMLVGSRLGVGLGRATVQPSHQSLLADYYPPNARSGVFAGWRLAHHLGLFAGALLGGALAALVGWRIPLLLLALPTFAFALMGTRLREPVRGAHERRAEGADEDVANVEEEALGWEESWRILKAIGTVRRIWRALPFLVGGILGFVVIVPLYYQDVFHIGAGERGVLVAINEPVQVVALLALLPVVRRILITRPSRVLKLFSLVAALSTLPLLLAAWAPSLPVAAAGVGAFSLCIAVLIPGVAAFFSLITPPRARSLGYAIADLWALPGLLLVLLVSAIAAVHGMRWAIVALAPIFLIGAAIAMFAGAEVEHDIERIRVAAVARAAYRLARESGRAKLLVCREISVRYDQVQVLFGVDFEVQDGEIVALLGTNGAGKSTLLRAIAGAVDPFAGAIIFDGRDMTHTPAQQTMRRGIVYMPGGRSVFPTLTVEENLRTAAWEARRNPSAVRHGIEDALRRFPALAARRHQPSGNLSGGEQQMLGLSMALLMRPKLLMIDELSLGLAPAVVSQLLETVREINRNGTTVVLVEQSVDTALKVAGRAVFMEKGEVRFEGPTAELFQRPDVLRSVFLEGTARAFGGAAVRAVDGAGDAASSNGHAAPHTAATPLLEVRGVTKHYGGIDALGDVSLALRDGEILGVIGPNGAGKTTLFDVISGFVAADRGRVHLGGTDVTAWSASRRARAGLGRSFQDARLFPSMTVREAIAVALDRHVTMRDPLTAMLGLPDQRVEETVIQRTVDQLVEMAGLTAFADKFLSELSTGSRRIVDIVCGLAHRPRVLLLDEPSSGIAQRETEALAPLIRGLRDWTGCGLLVIEHDMPLITSIADRIVALHLGRVVAEDTPAEVVRHPAVVSAYLGSEDVPHAVAAH